ncbi:GNAT family N-acetyltransferase [Actinomycetes bacterium KLBMP 9797]
MDERIATIMPAARLPVRDDRGGIAVGDVDLLAADLGRFPAVWPVYQRGLHEVYSGIGAGDLAMGPELPAGVTTVVVASTPGEEIVGGVLLREYTEIARYTGLVQIAAAIAERVPDGVNEIGGCWIRPAWRGAGLGSALVREVVRVAVGGGRWTVTLANQFSIGLGVRAGFVPDPRFRDLPFPDSRFRSTLCWFDHHGEGR